MCDQVLLSEIYTDPGGARVVVKELKANASAKEQNDFLQQGDPYRWTPTPEPLKFFLVFYFKTSVWTEISIWHQCNVSSTLYLSSHTSKILFAVLINIFLNMFYVLFVYTECCSTQISSNAWASVSRPFPSCLSLSTVKWWVTTCSAKCYF